MTSRRPASLRILGLALVAIAAAVLLAACGDDDSDSDTAASGSTAATAAGASTISVEAVDGLDAIVDAEGKVLYTNDQDTAGKIACTDECATIWVPVTTQGQPSADDPSVEAKLGVTTGPGGESQVTFDGKPLYSFTEEGPGELTGNGFTDSFGAVTFTWTAATAGGSEQGSGATTETETTETEDSGDSGGGGYGY